MSDSIRDKAAFPYVGIEQLLNNLGDGVIGVDRAGLVTFINPAGARLLGLSPEQAPGQLLSTLFQPLPEYPPLDNSLLQQCRSQGKQIGPFNRQRIKQSHNDTLLIDYSLISLDEDSTLIMFHDLGHTGQLDSLSHRHINDDPLTSLPNRDAIQQTLAHLHTTHQQEGRTYSILLLDLDRFKLINDSYGHSTGDLLLQHIAGQLKNILGNREYIARWGGEEFLCILPETDLESGLSIAEQVRKHIAGFSINIHQRDIFTTTSIGVASFPRDGETVADILRVADAALYEAKRFGRNRVSSSQEECGSFLSIATLLENALRENRIVPAYQPIVDLQTGQPVADEALARIVSPHNAPLPAGQFIDAAVHLQLVHRIDYEIVRQTILHCSDSLRRGENPLPHFVNVSAELLNHPQLVQGILDTAMQQCQVCGELTGSEKPLVIEITEQALLHNLDKARRVLAPFLDFGLRLAIDDFGVGYSSLNYLADLPVSFLKIDGQLVQRVATEKRIRAIIKGIQSIAADLDLITVGEFVEDQQTLEVLRDIGINWGQGYYFGKPQILHERFDI